MENSRILLVDGDLKKPGLHRYFNLPLQKGLTDYLQNRVAATDIITETSLKNVYLLNSGKTEVNTLRVLMSPEFQSLCDRLKNQFDYILVNSPPYRECIDTFVLAKFLRPTVLLLPSQSDGYYEDVNDVQDELGVLKLNIYVLLEN